MNGNWRIRILNDLVSKEQAQKLKEEWEKCFPAIANWKFPTFLKEDEVVPVGFNFGDIEQKILAMNFSYASAGPDNKFVPERDLPNPMPGDMCHAADGSFWYAQDNNTWVEIIQNVYGGILPTGRVIDLKNRGVKLAFEDEKTVRNSTAKSAICRNPWDHKWKHYVGLTQTFDYCEHCDEKR